MLRYAICYYTYTVWGNSSTKLIKNNKNNTRILTYTRELNHLHNSIIIMGTRVHYPKIIYFFISCPFSLLCVYSFKKELTVSIVPSSLLSFLPPWLLVETDSFVRGKRRWIVWTMCQTRYNQSRIIITSTCPIPTNFGLTTFQFN